MIKYIILMIYLLFSTQLLATTTLVSQGGTSVTTDDLDGFAYKIPKDKQAGFFNSVKRVDKTLLTLLKMKHIVNYAKLNNLLDLKAVKQNVQNELLNTAMQDDADSSSMVKLLEYKKYVDYLELTEAYKQFKQVITNSVKPEEVEELAHEKYITNKPVYVTKETRDLQVISVVYNDENKQEQYTKAEKILTSILTSNTGFKDYAMRNLADQADVELNLVMNGFHNNPKYKELAESVYNQSNTGIIKDLVDFNSRFSIVNIIKIDPSKQLSFDEVKKYIIEGLVKQKGNQKFSELLLELTQDPINIDKEIFDFIKQKYSTDILKDID